MISLFYDTTDRFSRYGMDHFIEKYGLSVVPNQRTPSGVAISYGRDVSAGFLITVGKNAVEGRYCGTITTAQEKIKVCEIPHDTGSGDEIPAYFEGNGVRYPCISRNGNRISIGIDIFRETGYLLSGHLDSVRPDPGHPGGQEIASVPAVDFLENLLFNAVRAGFSARKIPLVQKSFWPEGRPFAVCLTHDVDEIKKTYQWITRPARALVRGDFSGFRDQMASLVQKIRGNEPYVTYDDLIGIERSLGARSTYFILKESGQPDFHSIKSWYLYGRNRSFQTPGMQELIKNLLANGDEVAIHGSYFSYNTPGLLNAETRELETCIHDTIVGNRQHNLNLEIPETWQIQIDAGLKYDTTLGFKDTIGFRWGTSYPFFPNTGEEPLPLLEIPLIIMDICLERNRNRKKDCLSIADEVEKYQGVLTLLWHPPVINTLEYPGFRDLYIGLCGHCREKGAWITGARDIFEWVSLRNRQTFSFSYEDSACTILPSRPDSGLYFTLYLPPGTTGVIRSGNARIIRKDGDCIHIKTDKPEAHDTITVGIA